MARLVIPFTGDSQAKLHREVAQWFALFGAMLNEDCPARKEMAGGGGKNAAINR